MLEKLIEIGKRLLSESDINRVLTLALDGAIEITGAERGMVILFGSGDKILFETARNLKKTDIENPKFEVSQTIISRVKSDFKAICLHNALADPSFKKSASAVRLKILSVICLPLCLDKEIFGVVYLDNRTVLGAFEPDVCQFAQSFADFISIAAHHVLERRRLTSRVTDLEAELRDKYSFDAIIGHHSSMIEILKLVAQVADSQATVLIQGESGTGKELIARALHYNSRRREKPFIPINCGALPESLLESELFGHTKGAFTDAVKDRAGFFERADGGTIFLDEVAEMSPSLQVKLLRVLQTGEFSPVGSNKIRNTSVRIVAATNKDLKKLVAEKKFRDDLFYRLNVLDLQLPPLRERRSDIPLLARHFLNQAVRNDSQAPKRISADAEALLISYAFPGNIRELENVIERAVALADGESIEARHLPETIVSTGPRLSPGNHLTLTVAKRQAADRAERAVVENALKSSSGHITKAAQLTGVDVSNFHKIMRKHGINAGKFKP